MHMTCLTIKFGYKIYKACTLKLRTLSAISKFYCLILTLKTIVDGKGNQ